MPHLVALLLLTALGCACAGETVVAGPWVLVGDGDQVEVGVELAAPAGRPATLIELQRDGKSLGASVVTRPLTRPHQAPTVIATLRVVIAPVVGGTCTLLVDGVAHALSLPARPSSSAEVRVAVAGARNWPGPADLERLSQALGGPVSVVVAVGADVADCLGRGGWESRVPVLPLVSREAAPTAPSAARIAVDEAVWGPALGWWPAGGTWGMLGLPTGSDDSQARSAMARDLSPWLVYVARRASWDPALSFARTRGQMADLAPLIGFCQRFNVPVVLAAGGQAGWISEPLAVDQGRLAVRAEGTRIIGATPAGDPLASLPDGIALAVERPALVGISAATGELLVVLTGLGGDEPEQKLRYGVSGAERRRHGSGWGLAEVEVCLTAWMAGGSQAAAALEDLSWVAAPAFTRLRLGNDEFARLSSAAATDVAALRLLRRLVAVDQELSAHIAPALAQMPPQMLRDLVLRQIARPRLVESASWSSSVVSGDDATLLRAVLAAATDGGDPIMLDLLVKRLRNQADGSVPLESDSILQHRILCAVFDADTLSPTPLRAIALDLRNKVDALGKGPVERFLKRVGEKRPVGP